MENLAALRSLVAAVQEGSLSAAARRLHITQPAVSQQIAALEQAHGVELVIRGRNGITPTEAGRLAVSHATEVLARLAQMGDELAALQSSANGRLGVACALLMAQTMMVPVLADLRRSHPGLKIDLKANDLIQDMAEIGADLAIRAGPVGPEAGTVRKLAEIEQLLIASPSYLERVGRPKDIMDLGRLDYIQYKDDPEERTILMADGRHAPVTVAFAAQMPNLILHAVQNHLGFAKAPRFFVHELLARGEVVEVLPGQGPAPKPVYMVRAPGTQGASRRVAVFTERFCAQLARTPGFIMAQDLRATTAA
ncbi:LysR family transcriptional regulator [Neogemmobacter tilapiae]|uniref:Transcriptional regulator n=1 Tax=Neogemmobacter tilapiae TaxID=875041 RepID=A0A918TV19_9RHOB|nr:LysR family transcriptional regulator [Gemmobacter tilapiae]GHC62686.1 transcriptional regulator [Gemmobacter tilapiae]